VPHGHGATHNREHQTVPNHALATLLTVLSTFRLAFNRPAFKKFLVFAAGWILTQGPMHCVTEALVATDVARRRHWASYHRLFSSGIWDPDRLGFWLLHRLRSGLVAGTLRLVIDDTLCPKKGPKVFGIGTHIDAVRSTRKHKVFCFGHCWVVLAVLVQVPFSTRTWALPLLFRLYRSKADAGVDYRKKTELAREMLEVIVGWTERDQSAIQLAIDRGYANATVLGEVSERVVVVGAMRPDAALTDPPTPAQGPRRKKGDRRPSPAQVAEDPTVPWQHVKAHLYGQTETVAFKTVVAQWYRVTGPRLVRVVVVRCSSGAVPYRVFFGTDSSWTVVELLEAYAARWAIEVIFRDAKQLFGLADSPAWSEQAVRRVAPLVGLVMSALVVWFVDVFDSPVATLPVRPWYTQKKDLCFADILRAARRTLEGIDVLAWDAPPPSTSPGAQPCAQRPSIAPMPGFDVLPLAA
jgi:hypothetical protein